MQRSSGKILGGLQTPLKQNVPDRPASGGCEDVDIGLFRSQERFPSRVSTVRASNQIRRDLDEKERKEERERERERESTREREREERERERESERERERGRERERK